MSQPPAGPTSSQAYGEYECLLQCIEAGGELNSGSDPSIYNSYLPILFERYASEKVQQIGDSTLVQVWGQLTQTPKRPLQAHLQVRLRAFLKQLSLPEGQAADTTPPETTPAAPHVLEALDDYLTQLVQLSALVGHTLQRYRKRQGPIPETALTQLERRLSTHCPLWRAPAPHPHEVSLLVVMSWRDLPVLWGKTGLGQLAQTLLFTPHSTAYIEALVFNMPDQLETVVDALLAIFDLLSLKHQALVSQAIQTLCKFLPHRTRPIRSRLLVNQILPEVALKITLHFDPEPLPFLNSFFSTHIHWNSAHFPRCHPLVHELKGRLYDMYGPHTEPSALVYRILTGFTAVLQAPVEERDLQFIKNTLPRLTAATADPALALILAVVNPHRAAGPLAEILAAYKAQVPEAPSFLLIAIFLRTHEYDRVEAFVQTTLGLTTSIGKDRLYPIRELLIPDVLSDLELARLITGNAQANPRGVAPATRHLCAHNLLQHSVFQTHRVDIRPWLLSQIKDTTEAPAAPTVALIKEFVSAVFHCPTITRIPEADIRAVLGQPAHPLASQTLMLLYVLSYCDYLATNILKPAALAVNPGQRDPMSCIPYSDNLVDQLPIRRILNYITDRVAYDSIYPELVALCHYQAPETFDIKSVVMENYCRQQETLVFPQLHARLSRDAVQRAVPTSVELAAISTMPELGPALFQALRHPHSALPVLKYLATVDTAQLVPWVPDIIGTCLPLYLDARFSSETTYQFRVIWEIIHFSVPRQVETLTVNSWRRTLDRSQPPWTLQDLWLDPLLLFRCDPLVLRHPDFFNLFLQILGVFLIMSRHKLRAKHAQRGPGKGRFKDAHLNALLYLQDTNVLQMLLTICSQLVSSSAGASDTDSARACQNLIYDFLHQAFIENRLVCKLLHFQTFDPTLLPLLVEHIPSMHICFDFIAELLAQATYDRQIFGLQLATSLLEKYPMARNLNLIRETLIPRTQTLLVKFPLAESHVKVLYPVVDAITRIGESYPQLAPECKTLLLVAQTVSSKGVQEATTHGVLSTAGSGNGVFPTAATAGGSALNKCNFTLEEASEFRQFVNHALDVVGKRSHH